MTPFEELLKELGNKMGLNLKPDMRGSCLLNFAQGLAVQIDLYGDGDQILIGCELEQLPLGAYREKIFLQALRFNGSSGLPQGIFAFSKKNSSLVLFQTFPLLSMTGEFLFQFLKHFVTIAAAWKEALHRGEIPVVEETFARGSGMFGLR